MRRCNIIPIVVAVIVGAAACWYASQPWMGSRPQFLEGTPVSIDITVVDRPLTTITNAAAMTSVLEMLRMGRSVTPHECKSRGRMELHFADRQSVSVGFHPGHHSSRYEFGARGGVFEVSRSQFLEALSAAGVDVLKIPTQ